MIPTLFKGVCDIERADRVVCLLHGPGTRYHQSHVTFKPWSSYDKVPYSRAQHVVISGALTWDPMIISSMPLSTAPHMPTL